MMGRPTKTIESPPPDSTLEKYLLKLRNDEQEAIKIVEYLEGNSYQKDKCDLKYCKAYVIKLVQTYCETVEPTCKKDKYSVVGTASDKSELLLAVCGLLQGFEFKPQKQGQRILDYHAYVRDNNWYNELLIGTEDWSPTSVVTKVREILVDITKELANKVEPIKSKNDGKLGLMSQVSADQPLPAPHGCSKVEPAPTPPVVDEFRKWTIFRRIVSKSQKTKCEPPHIRYLRMIAISSVVIAISIAVIAITSVISLMSRDALPIDSPASISDLSPSPTQSSATDGVIDSFSNSDATDIQN